MGKRLEKGFYWRGGVIWVRTDPLTGKPKSTRCQDQEAAKLWRARRERFRADPVHATAAAATVGEWVVNLLAFKADVQSKSEATVDFYRKKLGHVVRIWGAERRLSDLVDHGADLVDRYIAQRRSEGVKANTIGRELTGIRQMLKLAKRKRAFTGDLDAILPIAFAGEYVPVKRTLRPEDLPALLDALPSDVERAWVCFAIATGADVGDIERALPEDYDPARRVVLIKGTKNKARWAEVAILDHVKPLFDFALAHLPVSWPRASKALGEACRRAGIGHLSPKDLRRTASTWLIRNGADHDLTSRFLRQKSSAMVRLVYGQLEAHEVGSLLAKQVDAKALQSALGSATERIAKEEIIPENKAERPLGGMADAGDLKASTGVGCSNSFAGFAQPSWTEPGRSRAEWRTETLQAVTPDRVSHGPEVWALHLAAESLLARRPAITSALAKGVLVTRNRRRPKGARNAG